MTDAPPCWLKPPGPVARGLRVGLLGGSFNPPHEGHVHISETALKGLGLDYVWWLVSPQNPLKPLHETAPLGERLALANHLAHNRRIIVTDVERILGTRFTVDTLAALRRRFPLLRFVWLMGSDNLLGFHRWKDWPRIAWLVPVAVVMRPGSTLAPLKAKAMQRFRQARRTSIDNNAPPLFVIVGGPLSAQSSTALRARQLKLGSDKPFMIK